MKRISIFFILTCILAGCRVKEDTDDCPPPGYDCVLLFKYYDENNEEKFTDHVEKADIYIYDEAGDFVMSAHLSQADLRQFQGIRLPLEPGTYMAVCWGNSLYGTHLTDDGQIETIDGSFVYYDGIIGSDALFYGPQEALFGDHDYALYSFTVPEGQSYEKTIRFTPAYREINVYVENYGSYTDPDQHPLLIHVDNMPDEHDFRYGHFVEQHHYDHPSRASYNQYGDEIYFTSVQVGMFGYDTPGCIRLEDQSTGNELKRLDLAQFIRENDINLTDYYDRTIDILFIFDRSGNVSVTVDVPDWELTDVYPGLI